jgi:hypothetical protein
MLDEKTIYLPPTIMVRCPSMASVAGIGELLSEKHYAKTQKEEWKMRKITRKKSNQLFRQAGIIFGLIAILALGAAPAMAADAPTIKIGLVTFLSGGAAGPFGIPGRNGA